MLFQVSDAGAAGSISLARSTLIAKNAIRWLAQPIDPTC